MTSNLPLFFSLFTSSVAFFHSFVSFLLAISLTLHTRSRSENFNCEKQESNKVARNQQAMKKQELIVVPAPGAGHIVSALKFAIRLLDKDDHIKVTVPLMKVPSASFLDSYVESLTESNPRIQVIDLPDIVYPPDELWVKATESYIDAFIESYKPHVRAAVSEIISSRFISEPSTEVAALILDFFCVTMIDVGNEFDIPSYIYFTSGAGFLSFMLSLPDRHQEVGREFINSDPELSLSTFANLVPVEVLPSAVFNTHGAYTAYVKISSRFREAKGIMVNTFAELESYAIEALSGGFEIPQIYPVGPLLDLKGLPNPELDREQSDKIMKWLDDQPLSSVLFLCFGSTGSFTVKQVEEIAVGLEESGCRFLWCLRPPLEAQDMKREEMLPEGFRERFEERGIICGWAPQVEVLAHKAIGGFMSHCGWNSILESLWHGVPILTLPISAEQQLNAFLMVKELGLAEELRLDYRRDHLVTSVEIAIGVRHLMQSDNKVRKKVKEMREMARKAVTENGSSSASITKFINDIA